MGLISREVLEGINLKDFPPTKVLEQLEHYPQLFEFLKSKEKLLGKTRPLVTFMCSFSIWIFKGISSPRRELSLDMLHALWGHVSSNRELAVKIEELEEDLWQYFLLFLKGATERENLSEKEIGRAALVFSTVLLALVFVFWPEERLPLLEKLIRTTGENID